MQTWFLIFLALLSPMLPAQGKGKGKGHSDSGSAAVVFTPDERRIISDYCRRLPASGLPPGLAKRDTLPPGLEKQLRRNGRLPPGLEKKLVPFPPDLERQLPPSAAGVQRG